MKSLIMYSLFNNKLRYGLNHISAIKSSNSFSHIFGFCFSKCCQSWIRENNICSISAILFDNTCPLSVSRKNSNLFKFYYAISAIGAIAVIWQPFVLHNLSYNNSDLFKFDYDIALSHLYIKCLTTLDDMFILLQTLL